jgi:hypothetical protein
MLKTSLPKYHAEIVHRGEWTTLDSIKLISLITLGALVALIGIAFVLHLF